MMSLAAHWPQALTSSLLSGSRKNTGLSACSAHAVWHAIQGYDLPDLDWSANSVHAAGLRPSELYERELERMVAVCDREVWLGVFSLFFFFFVIVNGVGVGVEFFAYP